MNKVLAPLLTVFGILCALVGVVGIGAQLGRHEIDHYAYSGQSIMTVIQLDQLLQEKPNADLEVEYIGDDSPDNVYVNYHFCDERSEIIGIQGNPCEEITAWWEAVWCGLLFGGFAVAIISTWSGR